MEESETNPQPEIQPVSPPPKTSFNLKWLIVPILLITLITLISLIFLSRSQTSQKTTNNQQSTISNTPSPSPNPTAGWKTFKSTTNDYVIEYPPDWSSRSVDRGTVISSYVEFSQPVPNVRAKIEISTYDNPKKLSSKEWINNPNKNRQDPDDSVESKPLTIDGIQAYVRVDNSLNSENTVIYLVYLQKDNKIYSFWAGGNKKYEQVLFQILSTFKFLDQKNCNNCPYYSPPHPDWCKDGKVVPADPIYHSNGDCYCSSPPKCERPGDNIQSLCESTAGGKWLAEYNECEGIESRTCSQLLNGEFNECASACRHNPKAEFCTQNCVPVCTVK